MDTKEKPKRGRPKSTVRWPNGKFTFRQLVSENSACDSLLRRRVREAVRTGEVSKVSTQQTAKTGRPETVYNLAPNEQERAVSEPRLEAWTQQYQQEESTGTNTPLS